MQSWKLRALRPSLLEKVRIWRGLPLPMPEQLICVIASKQATVQFPAVRDLARGLLAASRRQLWRRAARLAHNAGAV